MFSDYDIELNVDSLERYWHGDDWMDALGSILVRCPWKPASYQEGWLTRMAVFKDGFRIDFHLTDHVLDNHVPLLLVLLGISLPAYLVTMYHLIENNT